MEHIPIILVLKEFFHAESAYQSHPLLPPLSIHPTFHVPPLMTSSHPLLILHLIISKGMKVDNGEEGEEEEV